jgi:hypothetical protein
MQIGVGVAVSLKPLVPDTLTQDISYQFEFPIVIERNGRYFAIANYLPLIYPRFATSDSMYVIVMDLKPSLIKKVASNYVLHLMSFQTTYDLFYPLFKEVISLNNKFGHIARLSNRSYSERALADLLNVDRPFELM